MKELVRLCILCGCLVLLGASPTLAVSIDFVPLSQSVLPGRGVSVDVVVSGLGAGAPPSLGAFDLDVAFNRAVLTPTAVAFSQLLGDAGRFEALTAFSFSPGIVDLAAVSLLAPSVLDTLQPASFRLASLSFDTLAAGTSPLTFSQVILSDAFGGTLPATAGTGSVEVVPEPTSLVLVGLSAAGFGAAAWRHRRRTWLSRASKEKRPRGGVPIP